MVKCENCGSEYVNYLGYCLMCDYKTIEKCPYCGSTHIQKRGKKETRLGEAQYYRCMSCGRWFSGKSL